MSTNSSAAPPLDTFLPQEGEIWWASGSVQLAVLDAAVSVGSAPLSGTMRRQYEDLLSVARSMLSSHPSDERTYVSRDGKHFKVRPCIVQMIKDDPAKGTMVTAFVLGTYGGTPMAKLPELTQHFAVSVGDTRPWPAPDAPVIRPSPDWPKSRETPAYVIAHPVEIPLSAFVAPYMLNESDVEPCCLEPEQMLLMEDVVNQKRASYKGKSFGEALSWNDSWEVHARERSERFSQGSVSGTKSVHRKKKHHRTKSVGKPTPKSTVKSGAKSAVTQPRVSQSRFNVNPNATAPAPAAEVTPRCDASFGNFHQPHDGGSHARHASVTSSPPPPPVAPHPQPYVAPSPPPGPPPQSPQSFHVPASPQAIQPPQPSVGNPCSGDPGHGWNTQWHPRRDVRIHSGHGCAPPIQHNQLVFVPGHPEHYFEHAQYGVPQNHPSYGFHPSHAQPCPPAMAQAPPPPQAPVLVPVVVPLVSAPEIMYQQQVSCVTPTPSSAGYFEQQQQYHTPTAPHVPSHFAPNAGVICADSHYYQQSTDVFYRNQWQDFHAFGMHQAEQMYVVTHENVSFMPPRLVSRTHDVLVHAPEMIDVAAG